MKKNDYQLLEKPVGFRPLPLTELIEANLKFIRFLTSAFGVETAQKYLDGLQLEYYRTFFEEKSIRKERIPLHRALPRTKRTGLGKLRLFYNDLLFRIPQRAIRIVLPVIKFGPSTIYFSVYTYRIPGGESKDPVNLVFWNQARPGNLRDIMQNYFEPAWRDTILWRISCAEIQFLYIETSQTGGEWVPVRYSLSPQGCRLGTRMHIRLFDGGLDPDQGYVSVGAVHTEDFSVQSLLTNLNPHRVVDWDRAQSTVETQFVNLPRIVGSVDHVQLQPTNQQIQGVNNDGVASFIEIR